jgi:hypothetical protein
MQQRAIDMTPKRKPAHMTWDSKDGIRFWCPICPGRTELDEKSLQCSRCDGFFEDTAEARQDAFNKSVGA